MTRPASNLATTEKARLPAVSATRALSVRRGRAIVSEFQPDWIEIEERAPPRLAYLTLFLLTVVILCGIAWATVSEIDEIAVTRGKLITIEPNLVVQPLENAIIRSINVKVGEPVKAGQTLAVLDSTFAQADLHQLRMQFASTDALVKRLEAEMADTAYVPADASDPEQLLEARLYARRKAFNDSRLRQLDEERLRAEASAAKAKGEEAILLGRLGGVREIETMRATLLKNGIGSRLSVLQAQDARLDIEANLARLRGTQIESAHEIERTRAQRQAFIDEFKRTTLESLLDARARRDTASQDLKKAELRHRLVVLTAPADATVLEIAQRSLGSVIREAEPLLTLVPANVPLEAEVLVESKDIGNVTVGQSAKIKFDAFPFQKHGTGSGTVRVISRDAFANDSKENAVRNGASLFYKARITLSETQLRAVSDDFHLLPGMAVQAEIQTGKRSIISYFLYPLIRGLDESIRER